MALKLAASGERTQAQARTDAELLSFHLQKLSNFLVENSFVKPGAFSLTEAFFVRQNGSKSAFGLVVAPARQVKISMGEESDSSEYKTLWGKFLNSKNNPPPSQKYAFLDFGTGKIELLPLELKKTSPMRYSLGEGLYESDALDYEYGPRGTKFDKAEYSSVIRIQDNKPSSQFADSYSLLEARVKNPKGLAEPEMALYYWLQKDARYKSKALYEECRPK